MQGPWGCKRRGAALRTWLERLLLWRIWERLLEIEFVDRSVALAAKAFVSFFPLVIVVAAFVPDRAPDVHHHRARGPAGSPRERLSPRPGILRLVGGRPEGHGGARARAHDLLRDVVHDGDATRLPPRLASTASLGGSTRTGAALTWLAVIWSPWRSRAAALRARRRTVSSCSRSVHSRSLPRSGGSPRGGSSSATCVRGCWCQPVSSPASPSRASRCPRRSGCRRW